MKTIRVQASLRKALREDIFLPQNKDNPFISERVRANNVVFLWCPVLKKFKGVQTFWGSEDVADALIPLHNGSLYVLIEKTDVVRDEYVFGLVLEEAAPEQLKETEKMLRFGLVYFVMLNDGDVAGPLFLTPRTDTDKLAEQIKNKQVYLVSKNQTFIEIRKKNTA